MERTSPKSSRVMDSANAYVLVDMMRDVIRHGTGYGVLASGFTFPAAGKTGTTNDYTDAWFMGYTPVYTCGIWMGFDQKKKLGPGFTGAKVALPIWVDVMKVAHRNISPVEWPRPSRVVSYTACAKPNPDGTCGEQRMEFAVAGNPNLDPRALDSTAKLRPVSPALKPAAAPSHGTGTPGPATKADSSGPVRRGPTLF